MNAYKALAHTAVVGVIVGATAAPVSAPVHAAVALLSTDGVLSSSDTAIVIGGTTQPTPGAAIVHAAQDLFMRPLGFDGGATDSAICDMSGTNPCNAPLQVLTTPELFLQGQSSDMGAADLVQAVQNEISTGTVSPEHPLTVFGLSQSATVATLAMSRLAQDGVPSDDVRFDLIADPDTPGGAWVNMEPDLASEIGPEDAQAVLDDLGFNGVLGVTTPTDLYQTTIYTLPGDPIGDFQGDFTSGGWLTVLEDAWKHLVYQGMTPAEVANSTSTTVGDVTYIGLSPDFNEFDAFLNAIGPTLVGNGIFASIFGTILNGLDDLLIPGALS